MNDGAATGIHDAGRVGHEQRDEEESRIELRRDPLAHHDGLEQQGQVARQSQPVGAHHPHHLGEEGAEPELVQLGTDRIRVSRWEGDRYVVAWERRIEGGRAVTASKPAIS